MPKLSFVPLVSMRPVTGLLSSGSVIFDSRDNHLLQGLHYAMMGSRTFIVLSAFGARLDLPWLIVPLEEFSEPDHYFALPDDYQFDSSSKALLLGDFSMIVPCPSCRQPVGEGCLNKNKRKTDEYTRWPHYERIEEAHVATGYSGHLSVVQDA